MSIKNSILFACLLAAVFASLSCCDANTIEVVGSGQVSVNPDTATINVGVTEDAKTSALALSNVNDKINALVAILAANGIQTSDYSTSSISISPVYNYTNGVTLLEGQQASQSLSVNIKNIGTNASQVSKIITKLSNVNNITISGLSFINSDPSTAASQARNAAFLDAQMKAKSLASQSGRQLGRVSQINDQNTDTYSPFTSDVNLFKLSAATLMVPFGQVQVSASVQVIWNLSG